MHKLIKAELEKDFDTLNKHLVKGSEHSNLLLVIDTLKKVMDGAPYVDEVEDMFTKYPDLDSPPVQEAVSSIVNFLAGAHPLIKQCFIEDQTNSPLGYRCALTNEIATNVNFFTVYDNGDIIANDVFNMSFISEVEALGRLSITEQHEA